MALSEAEIKERKNAARRTEEFRVQRRATRDLAKEREYCRAYYQRNVERMRQRGRNYNADPKNAEHLKQKRKEWYERGGKEAGRRKIRDVELRYAREALNRDGTLTGTHIPIELIQAKQAEIKLKRLVDEMIPPEKRKAIAKAERMALRAARMAEQKKATIERRKAQAREKYQLNREKELLKLKNYREKNRELIKAKAREKYHANKEEINAKRRNISPEKRAHINALARTAEAKLKLKRKQEGVAQ
jgi:hypothetical protein